RAISSSNVYFVGNLTTDGPTNQEEPWSINWNGSSFGAVQFLTQPFPGAVGGSSFSVVNDLDAVGSSPLGVGFGSNAANVPQGVIWRRNASAWNPTAPFADATSHILNSVQAVGTSNIWTVGERINSSGEKRTWIVHWNGASWVSLGGPNPRPGDSTLKGI